MIYVQTWWFDRILQTGRKYGFGIREKTHLLVIFQMCALADLTDQKKKKEEEKKPNRWSQSWVTATSLHYSRVYSITVCSALSSLRWTPRGAQPAVSVETWAPRSSTRLSAATRTQTSPIGWARIPSRCTRGREREGEGCPNHKTSARSVLWLNWRTVSVPLNRELGKQTSVSDTQKARTRTHHRCDGPGRCAGVEGASRRLLWCGEEEGGVFFPPFPLRSCGSVLIFPVCLFCCFLFFFIIHREHLSFFRLSLDLESWDSAATFLNWA